jgi:uncharacterized protein YoxC
MDLTLFIVMVTFSIIIYYLISCIQSLLQEIKEVKNKCIHTNNSKVGDFKVETPDPAEEITKKAVETFINLKQLFK